MSLRQEVVVYTCQLYRKSMKVNNLTVVQISPCLACTKLMARFVYRGCSLAVLNLHEKGRYSHTYLYLSLRAKSTVIMALSEGKHDCGSLVSCSLPSYTHTYLYLSLRTKSTVAMALSEGKHDCGSLVSLFSEY